MTEKWIPWEPIQNSTGPYSVINIFYDTPGLTVLLEPQKSSGKKLQILFDGCIEAYRFTDIGYLQINRDRSTAQWARFFSQDGTFFKILNSNYLKRLSIQSCSISDTRNLMHFVIVALDGIIEVAYSTEPIITEFESVLKDESLI